MSVVALYAVFADAGEAERIGRALVEEGLAACVNLLGPCRSIYRWQGRVEEAEEVPAILKTTEAMAGAAAARIGELHSYDVPAIAVWPAAFVPPAYARWVEENVRRD